MYTEHALKRSQQRSIAPVVVDILLEFGKCGRHKGAAVYYMTPGTRKQAKYYLGQAEYKKIENRLNTFAVVSDDGPGITLCHRTKRLKF